MQAGVVQRHEVVDRDVYVIYTDGVSDNLFVDQGKVKMCIADYFDRTGTITSLSSVADCIAYKAQDTSKSKKIKTPYSERRKKSMFDEDGGIQDDITVTVAQIFLRDPPSP